MTAIDKKTLIEDRVNTGLLGQWYPVAKSVEVKTTQPLGVRALGQKLVLWRGADGRNVMLASPLSVVCRL